MAIVSRIVVVLAIYAVVLLPMMTIATQYTVGDGSGWTINFDYQAWVKNKNFRVGDSLAFNYPQGLHNVFKVNGSSFASCIIPPPDEAHTSGHDIISLSAPGKEWFICGVGEHCSEFGQKLAIDVKA